MECDGRRANIRQVLYEEEQYEQHDVINRVKPGLFFSSLRDNIVQDLRDLVKIQGRETKNINNQTLELEDTGYQKFVCYE